MMGEKQTFRHELKYLISYADMELLRLRLGVLMRPDENTVNGFYKIRSLYFDDYWNTAYEDKLSGVYHRKKYRIRIYNDSDAVIKLECKHKLDQYIRKTSASLTRAETEDILAGKYGFLLKKDSPLCREFYYQCTSRMLRPRVIVDYEREPYVCDAGDVRVTFDRDVRATNVFADFFSGRLPSQYVMEDGKVVMEVKFTEFLPKYIKKALSCGSSELTAYSKYVECLEKISYAFLHDRSGI